jgi:predicted nucleotidyltransferase
MSDCEKPLNFKQTRKRGRPRKDVDVGIVFHMIRNKAPIAAVSRHLNIHRDTLYANFRSVIDAARLSHSEAWKVIYDEMFARFLERKRLKEEAKRRKRGYRTMGAKSS